MVDSSATGVASAIFTSLEETEVLPFCEMKMLFWPLSCLKKGICVSAVFTSVFNNNEAEELSMGFFCSLIRQSIDLA